MFGQTVLSADFRKSMLFHMTNVESKRKTYACRWIWFIVWKFSWTPLILSQSYKKLHKFILYTK